MTKRNKRILIGTDGSEFSKLAVESACEFMTTNETEVVCLSVYENPVSASVDPAFVTGEYYGKLLEGLIAICERHVQEAQQQIRMHFSEDEVPVTTQVLNGFPDNLIVEKAKDWDADLIVVGSHGRGFWGRLLGSVSTGVVHHAHCSVLVVKRPVESDNKNVD